MKKSLLILICSVLPTFMYAQHSTYEWSWALRGGGSRHFTPYGLSSTPEEQQRIYNIKVDTHNNHYYLAHIAGEGINPPTLGNIPNDTIMIRDYSGPENITLGKSRNTYLVSTNCEGDFRWHKSIGGTGDIYSYGLGTDNHGGVYMAGNSGQYPINGGLPLHYDEDTIRNSLSMDKNLYLIKYDTLGNFQWLREPQPKNPNHNYNLSTAMSGEIFVENDGTVHWLVVLEPNSSLENGAVVAQNNYLPITNSQVGDIGVLKYDKNGNFLGYTRLDINMYGRIGMTKYTQICFTYDTVYEQYYINAYGNTLYSDYHTSMINGSVVNGSVFLAAFNANTGNNVWWDQIPNDVGADLKQLITDSSGNLYITGRYFAYLANGQISGYPTLAGLKFYGDSSEAFCMKIDHNGQGIWVSTAYDSYAEGQSLTVNDDGVFLGLGYASFGGGDSYWGNINFNRPSGFGRDPIVVHLDKDTGEAIDIYEIRGAGFGKDDEITAIETDRLGNILVGGFMRSVYLFDNQAPMSKLNKKTNNDNDFFIAQLGKDGVSCSDPILKVSENEKLAIKLWPNPTRGRVHIESESFIDSINIYNVLGQKADVLLDNTSTANGQMIDISSLSSGIYFIEIQSGTQREIKKIIKE
ncbi:Por secretion system C-terminal sorting domain-containing protein [Mesonia phycicola]|uniref:Por secretion system C-terminal sorting domain-containing protein n=1 Tax=Mesonia phycicola TaxID=579105 RepID=A0A1M6A8J2_9FLAO|nr:T9SS type A sorting domain-containing protein [Mesonia phycicola]SHI32785.1 Por secretion system C-terminal sorting domain-containing protein [Mesonia phycicola]